MALWFWDIFTLVVLFAGWIVGEATVRTKLVLTVIYLAIWGIGWFFPYVLALLPLYALGVYFFFLGSEKGRRWRP